MGHRALCVPALACAWVLSIAALLGCGGIKADAATRPIRATHFTFLVDTSCSMDEPTKLGLVRSGLTAITADLSPDDTVAIATYSEHSSHLLVPTPVGGDGEGYAEAISSLKISAGANLATGLESAYVLANQAYLPSDHNRVVLLTDGAANIGFTDPASLLQLVHRYAERGITLTGLGFGADPQDELLALLTDQGGGRYVLVGDTEDMRRALQE